MASVRAARSRSAGALTKYDARCKQVVSAAGELLLIEELRSEVHLGVGEHADEGVDLPEHHVILGVRQLR